MKTYLRFLLIPTILSLKTVVAQTPSSTSRAAPADDETIELAPFVVYALSDERNRSAEEKRDADSIGDFLSTDRLGQYVDTNIGSVVERLPGVYTSGAGQSGGSGISIRGFGGGFNSLQLDGDRLPSNQGGTRGVSIDNIPAELIGSISIFKAPTPERDADSIGGVVNVETKSGLDLSRRLITARALYGMDDYGDGWQKRGAVTYSNRLNRNLGIFLSLTRAENEKMRDEIRADPEDYVFDQLVTKDSAFPRITDSAANRVFLPSRVDYRRTIQSNQNTGANLNLDWQVRPDWRLSLRTFYSQFNEQRPQIRNLWRYDRSTGNDPVNRSYPHAEYVYLDESSDTFYFGNEQRIARRAVDQDEEESIRRLQVEGRHHWHDADLDYSASFGRSRRDFVNDTFIFTADDIQLRAQVADLGNPNFSVINPGDFFYNSSAKPHVPDFLDPATYGPTTRGYFNITERRAESIKAKDRIDTYQVNYRRTLSGDFNFKAGAKYRAQRKDNQRDFIINPGFVFNAANAEFSTENGFFNGRQDLGLFPTYDSLRTQNPTDPRTLISNVLGSSSASADNRRDSTIQDLAAKEEVSALYAQVSRDFGPLTVLGGLRWERTETDYRGFTADVTGNPAIDLPRAVRGTGSYDGIYPSIHLNYRLRHDTYLRAALGRTLSRPEFEELTPSSYATLSTDSDTGRTIVNLQRGNSKLKPTQSTNLDISIEHYFPSGGVASLAGYYKELRNWIYDSTFIAPPANFPEYAAIPNLQSVRVTSSLNGDLAKVYGFEASIDRNIAWGFSASASFTMLSFEVNKEQTGLDRVPGQSDRLIRAGLNYESKKFLARLSLRDSGKILDEQVSFSTPAAIAYFQALGVGNLTRDSSGGSVINLGLFDVGGTAMDFVAEYEVMKKVRIFIQGSNLLGENSRSYLDNIKRLSEKNEYRSWSALAGIKVSL